MAQRWKTIFPFAGSPAWAADAIPARATMMERETRTRGMLVSLRFGWCSVIALGGFNRSAERDRVGDRRKFDRIDAGAFDAQMAVAQDSAPETLIDLHALDVVDRHF